ncbi:D-aspartate oxidase [Cylas formicarius]|uniref:D-aspartate oxidase n=1 Tax=Cylas formicarius TaxID=197179 RepID=UPI0029583F49|nr:D-aspartate oxidase [Cylas formicarius]
MPELKIAVIGAGVIGFTTALELKNAFRNANIEILADKFNTETTSSAAAGVFRPGTSFCGPTEEITRKWIEDSYYYWEHLCNTSEGAKAGVKQLSGYIFSSQYPHIVKNRYIEKLVPVYRAATSEELQLCPGNWKYGSFFITLLTECDLYLPWAIEKFINAGGKITGAKVESLETLGLNYDVVVNCTGLGARYLCNDHKVVPIRGQVYKVRAPWIKTFFYGDYDTYILPGFTNVTLGGCRQYESYNLDMDEYDARSIWHRCTSLVPSLAGAEIVAQRVGLRPHRSEVRLENEVKNINGRVVRIVHNYGHGGYGVTTAPGTSLHACKLVREAWSSNSKL